MTQIFSPCGQSVGEKWGSTVKINKIFINVSPNSYAFDCMKTQDLVYLMSVITRNYAFFL